MIGVKCSLCTHEVLTSDPQHPSKKPGVAEHVSKPNTGEEGRDRPVPVGQLVCIRLTERVRGWG